MRHILVVFFLGMFSLTVNSQNSPDEMVKIFFEEFNSKGASIALDNLYKSNKWIDSKSAAVINLKEKMGALTEDFVGKLNGYELIVEKKLSSSFILRSYLVKYERQPIRFTFQFYKPNKIWKIQSFKYDGDLDDEVEEAAKLYYLKLNN